MTAANSGPGEATTSNGRSAVGEAAAGEAGEGTDDHTGEVGTAQAPAGAIAVTTTAAMQTQTTSRRDLIT
jgi:hypothetical protein